ncbi:MAG: ABC transporter ATP-binding protein [Actinobacteria bacterium]|nr:ABC transporter ATP-binding protein [Actinomycetota bacterium]
MTTVLKAEGLRKTYKLGSFTSRVTINALDDINLDIVSDDPVIVSLVGESGSGKTTLAKTILRLVEPTAGKAWVHDQVVTGSGGMGRLDFMRMVQPIFQNPFDAFSRYRTVDTYLHETAARIAGLNGAKGRDAVDEALSSVGLDYADVVGKYPNQFSGGELQRASIARALIPHPQLIVADEPVSMIDASRRMIVINLFKALKEQYRTSFLYITHDLATAYYISDYIAVMSKGRIVEFGAARDVLSTPRHDYTKLLLSSIPTLTHKWDRTPALASTGA